MIDFRSQVSLFVLLLTICTHTNVFAEQSTIVNDWNEDRVAFWIHIYAKHDSSETLIHDTVFPKIIYETVKFPPAISGDEESRESILEKKKQKYRGILKRFDMGQVSFRDMSVDELRVYNLFQSIKKPFKYRDAAKKSRMRVQDGRKDLFIEGLKRAGLYRQTIADLLDSCGLPGQLLGMVFVESLFYPKAVSHAGAGGLWQLMPGTAKSFIQVRPDVDERFDPMRATFAACQILKQNYKVLKKWSLAITAYNHGLAGMRRAQRRHGTDNLENIIKDYRSGQFGFASKNFYAQYLAAVDVLANQERYFGTVVSQPQLIHDELALPYAVHFYDVVAVLELPAVQLEQLNPALTTDVIYSRRPIPPGYLLKLPEGKAEILLEMLRTDKLPQRQQAKHYSPTPIATSKK